MQKKDSLFIDGEFLAPATSQTIEVVSPFTAYLEIQTIVLPGGYELPTSSVP